MDKLKTIAVTEKEHKDLMYLKKTAHKHNISEVIEMILDTGGNKDE